LHVLWNKWSHFCTVFFTVQFNFHMSIVDSSKYAFYRSELYCW
jgi:hypothetical protein